jgi:hypothetical protein
MTVCFNSSVNENFFRIRIRLIVEMTCEVLEQQTDYQSGKSQIS